MARQLFQVRAQLIDLRLNLGHARHLNAQLVIDSVNLNLDKVEKSLTTRRFLTRCALRTDLPFRAFRAGRSPGAAKSSLSNWSTRADSAPSPVRSTPARRSRRSGRARDALWTA